MADSGMFRTAALQGWQRTNVIAAANYLREQIARNPDDPRLRAAYEGLLDLLDPSRMLARRQREMADAAKQAAAVIKQERRRAGDRRRAERRAIDRGPAGGQERRAGRDRRGGSDRRR
jgi:hypothetical protein